MEISVVQFTPTLGDVEGNRGRILRLLRGLGSELVVLPELATSGYLIGAEAREVAEPLHGPTARAIAEACASSGSHVVLGYPELGPDGEIYNSAMVVGPGKVIGNYRKTHLFGTERSWARPGDTGFVVWELAGVRVGVMICFDWFFPEAARTLALLGAQVIAHPANLVLPWCQRAMPIRALENHLFTATANRVGREVVGQDAASFTGGSLVVGPDGSVLASGPRDRDAVLTVRIDPSLADDKSVGQANDLFLDRRPELYRLRG